jgi:hypothetical protein
MPATHGEGEGNVRDRDTPYNRYLAEKNKQLAEKFAAQQRVQAERDAYRDALIKIADWPDDGNTDGQTKIRAFALETLEDNQYCRDLLTASRPCLY